MKNAQGCVKIIAVLLEMKFLGEVNVNIKSLASIPAAALLALGAMVTGMLQPAAAQQGEIFFCGTHPDGTPTTMARTNYRGSMPVIKWKTEYFSGSGWTPQRRCEEVSRRFQVYYENGQLNYLTTGRMNGYPVICIARNAATHDREPIEDGGLLITLRPKVDKDPEEIMKQIMGVRDFGGTPLEHAVDPAMRYDEEGNLYINLEEYFFRAQEAIESN